MLAGQSAILASAFALPFVPVVGVRLPDFPAAVVAFALPWWMASRYLNQDLSDPTVQQIATAVLRDMGIGLVAAPQRGERLAELAVHERQPRLQADGLAEAGLGLREALLHCEDAPEVLVQVREFRLERDCLADDLFRFRVARLFHEGIAQQAQVVDAARAVHEVLATDGLRPVRAVGAQRFEGLFEACLGGYFRYLSNHARTRSR